MRKQGYKLMMQIGTAFRTVFARMSNIKLGRLIDEEDGSDMTKDLSDAETVLRRIGINLRKSATEFNDFGGVLDQVGEKWQQLSDVDKSVIATAFAGTRQKENILTMFENYDKVLKYTQTAAESAGTANEKYQTAYINSIESKMNSFKATFESLSRSLIDSDLVKFFIDAGGKVLNLLDGTGKLVPTVWRLVGAFTALALASGKIDIRGKLAIMPSYAEAA